MSSDLQPLIGIPYIPGGRTHAGVDCYGLVFLFYRDVLGIELPRLDGEPDLAELKELSHLVKEEQLGLGAWQPVPLADASYGDVVELNVFGGNHAGIYLPPHRMLHAMPDVCSCIVDIEHRMWRRRIVGCYRRA